MAISKVVYGGQVLIDLTQDTVVADKLLSGYTAHKADGTTITGTCTYDADTSDATAQASEILATKTAYVNGSEVVGTMPNIGAATGSISDKDTDYTIGRGYHDGTGTVGIASVEKAKLIAGNIKDGVTILGVEGEYTGEGATLESKTATPYTTSQTILPSAGYDGISQITIDAISYVETDAAVGGGKVVTIGTVAPAVGE